MTATLQNQRKIEAEVDPIFTDRWSPRAFATDPITDDQLRILFEAARWAPSCFNEQPWEFRYAITREAKDKFLSVLADKNKTWAKQAPMLVFVLARRTFQRNNSPNRHAQFDTGAAWISLAFQARKLGLYAHGMAGFNLAKAYDILGVSEKQYDILAAVAVGKHGNPSSLPEDMRRIEVPNDRNQLAQMAIEFK